MEPSTLHDGTIRQHKSLDIINENLFQKENKAPDGKKDALKATLEREVFAIAQMQQMLDTLTSTKKAKLCAVNSKHYSDELQNCLN